jgi:hypothetical protein
MTVASSRPCIARPFFGLRQALGTFCQLRLIDWSTQPSEVPRRFVGFRTDPYEAHGRARFDKAMDTRTFSAALVEQRVAGHDRGGLAEVVAGSIAEPV